MSYLIDPQGHWHRWPSETLAERLGYRDPDFDLAGYAVRNLGYVWLLVEDQATFLQFRAGTITRAALESLRPYLKSAVANRPVGLVFYASGWLEEAHVEATPLLARIEELAVLQEPRRRDLFIRHSHSPREWLYNGHPDLAGLFELWRFVGGEYSDPINRYLERTGLINRTVLLKPEDDGGIYVDNSGSGFTVYDQFSFHSQRRRRIEDQPDAAYGRWVAEAYRRALNEGAPQIDDIDAIVEEPGHDPRRRRYQRVILRWNNPGGGVMLTGSSLITQRLAIPLDVGLQSLGPGIN